MIQKKKGREIPSLFCVRLKTFDLSGLSYRAKAEEPIRRTPSNEAGQHIHRAQPAPRRLGADKNNGDQSQAADDADKAVNSANILRHGKQTSFSLNRHVLHDFQAETNFIRKFLTKNTPLATRKKRS
jgi:hypothetical protein